MASAALVTATATKPPFSHRLHVQRKITSRLLTASPWPRFSSCAQPFRENRPLADGDAMRADPGAAGLMCPESSPEQVDCDFLQKSQSPFCQKTCLSLLSMPVKGLPSVASSLSIALLSPSMRPCGLQLPCPRGSFRRQRGQPLKGLSPGRSGRSCRLRPPAGLARGLCSVTHNVSGR